MASSGTYKDRRFNLAAQGHRQPGSAFKTMVLIDGHPQGRSTPTGPRYTSKPLNLNVPGYGPWKVKTYGNTYGGIMNLVRGTLTSDNTVYAQLIIDVGPEGGARDGQADGHQDQARRPAGRGPRRPAARRLAARDGQRLRHAGLGRHAQRAEGRSSKVEFPDGKSDDLGKPKRKRVFTDGQAYEVTQDPRAERDRAAPAPRAQIGCPAAGKTGTTDNFNDAWFVGYTPKLATSVWVGYPERAAVAMPGAWPAARFPARIWHDYMIIAKGDDCSDFPQPTERAEFSPFFGKYASTGQRLGRRQLLPLRRTPTGTAATTPRGGQDYRGYDPRLYEAPPQQAPAPRTAPPATERGPRAARPAAVAATAAATSTAPRRAAVGAGSD